MHSLATSQPDSFRKCIRGSCFNQWSVHCGRGVRSPGQIAISYQCGDSHPEEVPELVSESSIRVCPCPVVTVNALLWGPVLLMLRWWAEPRASASCLGAHLMFLRTPASFTQSVPWCLAIGQSRWSAYDEGGFLKIKHKGLWSSTFQASSLNKSLNSQ